MQQRVSLVFVLEFPDEVLQKDVDEALVDALKRMQSTAGLMIPLVGRASPRVSGVPGAIVAFRVREIEVTPAPTTVAPTVPATTVAVPCACGGAMGCLARCGGVCMRPAAAAAPGDKVWRCPECLFVGQGIAPKLTPPMPTAASASASVQAAFDAMAQRHAAEAASTAEAASAAEVVKPDEDDGVK